MPPTDLVKAGPVAHLVHPQPPPMLAQPHRLPQIRRHPLRPRAVAPRLQPPSPHPAPTMERTKPHPRSTTSLHPPERKALSLVKAATKSPYLAADPSATPMTLLPPPPLPPILLAPQIRNISMPSSTSPQMPRPMRSKTPTDPSLSSFIRTNIRIPPASMRPKVVSEKSNGPTRFSLILRNGRSTTTLAKKGSSRRGAWL